MLQFRNLGVKEIVVVCDPSYQSIFEDVLENDNIKLKFALPGKEGQDFVYNGVEAIGSNSELVCIHDSARPLVSTGDIERFCRMDCVSAQLYQVFLLKLQSKSFTVCLCWQTMSLL